MNQGGAVEIVSHSARERAQRSNFGSVLSSHCLSILPPAADWVIEEGEHVIRGGHKLGGRPYFARQTRALADAVAKLQGEGFSHVVQFDVPDLKDGIVSADWPFGDGIVSVFGRNPPDYSEWRWCWDF
jgi:hypothetical protein